MYPELHLGPLTLQSFGLMFVLGFIAAGALVWKRLGEIGEPVDWSYEMGFAALVGGVVGSRLYFVVQNYSLVEHDLVGNFFSGAGLVCTACTYCQIQFDTVRADHLGRSPQAQDLPAVLYTQLLGRSLGLDRSVLGIDSNRFAWLEYH